MQGTISRVFRLVVIFMLLLVLSVPFASIVSALSYAPSIKLDPPILDTPASAFRGDLTSGQQVVISTTARNQRDDALDFLAIVEVRNAIGVTEFLGWQGGSIGAGKDAQLGMAWTPAHGGSYELRTFTISGLANPQVLSIVEASSVEIRHACSGDAACLTGTITNIVDGDTLDIGNTVNIGINPESEDVVDTGDARIRLALVNSPERSILGYQAAKEFTETTCPVGSEIFVDEDDGQTEGSYGRMIAKLYCAEGAILLNEELLRSQNAVLLPEFCNVSEFAHEQWAQQYGCKS